MISYLWPLAVGGCQRPYSIRTRIKTNSTYLNELMNRILHSGDLGKALALANYQGLYTNAWASPQLTRNSVSQSNDATQRSRTYTGVYPQFLQTGLEGQRLGNEAAKLQIGIYKEHPEYLGGYGWGGYGGKPGDTTWTTSTNWDSYMDSGQGADTEDNDQGNGINLKNSKSGQDFLNGGF